MEAQLEQKYSSTANLENTTSHRPTISEIKNAFYQCEFNRCIELAKASCLIKDELGLSSSMLIVRSLFEQGHCEKAQTMLAEDFNGILSANPSAYYVQGSLAYIQGQYDQSHEFFHKMLQYNQNATNLFKAMLALANIHYSQKEISEAMIYVRELEIMQKQMTDLDLLVSFQFLKANLLCLQKKDLTYVKDLYENVYVEATLKDWDYFALKSIYYLAKWEREFGSEDIAKGLLKGLDLKLRTIDWRAMSMLVDKEFKHINHISSQVVKLDQEMKALIVGVKDQYVVELERWPSLYKTAEALYLAHDYVSKQTLASIIWPKQKYMPRTHDARLYELLSRLKKQLQLANDYSLVIEAKNGAYKLVY